MYDPPRFMYIICNVLCLVTPAVPSVQNKDKSEVSDFKFLKN